MKCPRCQQQNPPQAKFCLKCGTPLGQVNDSGGSGASYADLQHALAEVHSELAEALDRQTAASEILGVISSSPTDVQPVLDAVAENSARLCAAEDVSILERAGDVFRVATLVGATRLRDFDGAPISRDTVAGRALLSGQPVHVHDITHASAADFPLSRASARHFGHRTMLALPLLREGAAIGVIFVRRTEVHPFSAKQIALLKTFADQAVIAIENVRLFKELETRNRDLSEALEQQTATAEILRVISSSPSDTQPVFETIARSAVRLCDAVFSAVFRLESGQIHRAAAHGPDPAVLEADRRRFPLPMVERDSLVARAMAQRAVLETPDVEDASMTEMTVTREAGRALGFRSELAVPMLRGDEVIGAVAVNRREPGRFTVTQIELLKTFADQAVIAIENVRLFTETKEALERQTATAEILRVISNSPTDITPVLDAVAERAAKLCEATDAIIRRVDAGNLPLAAHFGPDPVTVQTDAINRRSVMGRAVLECRTIHVHDITSPESQSEFAAAPVVRHATGHRTLLAVPLVREGTAIGVIIIRRREVRPFAEAQIKLLETFADQAVIAIENVRLFKELEARTSALTRSVEQLTALGEVGRAVSSTLDLETVLTTIVSRAVELSGLDGGVVFEYNTVAEEFEERASTGQEALAEARRRARIRKGEGVVGRTAVTHEPVQVPDITREGAYESRLRESLVESGVRALLAVPMLREGHLIGSLVVARNTPGTFPPETVDLLRTFATQSALAIQNARLFREIAEKSRQLETASQHKSEFLANMSHELRTPLNAVIGFSEVLSDRMFGELNAKQDEYLKDIHASGQHLLSLINDILDLSKIEAGRMELELTHFHLPAAIDNALALVRERAGRRGIAVRQTMDGRLGEIQGDERKIKQVMLNLLSNALKFTPEGGRIDVRAGLVDGVAEISVADTGIGIAPEDQGTIFEEFRQVGTADKKVEGTGLGLALSRKFVELHGGRIWVHSRVGAGSTFTFSIPVRHDERAQ